MKLPDIATAPFCPSEVEGAINIPPKLSLLKKLLLFTGPGLLVAVGYMDPGNWATDLEAGSRFGYTLLYVILFSSMTAMFLQSLSMRLGVVTGKDLAKLCFDQYSRTVNIVLWLSGEVAIIATDIAEVLGSALAFHLLFGFSMPIGILLTSVDTLIVLAFQGKGFRRLEALILGLVSTIGIAFFVELFLVKPQWNEVLHGMIPLEFPQGTALYIAVGILGATVMPHNLFLHSAIVHTRNIGDSFEDKKSAIRFFNFDLCATLFFAFLVNAAILIMASAAFNKSGYTSVTDISEAYRLLEPLTGLALGKFLFGIALLAAGQSSTLTGTIAGQVLFEGFLNLKMPCWKRRLITRSLALVPAFIGISILGDGGVSELLVISQVVLSLQLPLTLIPIIQFSQSRKIMNQFALGSISFGISCVIFLVIVIANISLFWTFLHR